MESKLKVFGLAIILSFLILSYNNCSKNQGFHSSKSAEVTEPSSDQTGGDGKRNINSFVNPRPDTICGESGFKFIKDEYLFENCVGCHAKGGLVEPPLGDQDLDTAYQASLFVEKSKFLETVSKNPLCGDCNLDPEGEVYKGLEEWLDSRFSTCP